MSDMSDVARMRPLAEWPLAERRAIRGILTDIDDTLTTHGRLTPAVLQSITDLRAAGIRLIAVTGRPTYWALPLLRLCGFDAVIAENGASAFWLDADGRQQSHFYADAPTRLQHRRTLEEFAAQLRRRFPHIPVADDAAMRVGDLAFDIGEHAPALSPDEVDSVLAFMRGHGFFAAASSIHAHASLAQFSKQATSERILHEVFGVDDTTAQRDYAFIGDSGNDASMFAHYPHAIGVANVTRFLDKLPVVPAYVTAGECGKGFVEMARAILDGR